MVELTPYDYAVRIAVLEEQVKSQRREIDAQAKEYERRLAELNNLHAKNDQDRALFVKDDKFEDFQAEMREWRGKVSDALAELQGRAGGATSARGIVFQIIPMIIALVAVIALVFKK